MHPQVLCTRTHPLFLGALAASVISCTLGCVVPTRVAGLDLEIPRSATPVAIRAGLEAMDDPATEQRLQHMLASQGMRAVQREIIAGLLDGTLATLDEKQRSGRIDALATRMMTGLLRGAERDLPPMARDMSRSAVNGALDAGLDPGRRSALESSVHVLVSTSVRSATKELKDAGLGKTVSAAMSEEIGPAFKRSMRDDVAPGLAEMMKNEDFRRELGATARVIGREMVLGATVALAEKKDPNSDGKWLSRMASVAQGGATLFGSAAWLLLLVILALFVWIAKLLVQTKRLAAAPLAARPRHTAPMRLRGRRRAIRDSLRGTSHVD